jgi:UDP-N-acetylglucosamine--N-acetylmuramyl-(pentapeptide) pyrophosphoryl-undecaprenol N-acetylglucosamine transferase
MAHARPLLIHEQNAVAGTTNRWLARFATRMLEAFPASFPKGVRTRMHRQSGAPRDRRAAARGRAHRGASRRA